MKNDRIVYTCDTCQIEVKDGFFILGRICSVKNSLIEKISDLSSDQESHYCKPCFKAKLGLKERARHADVEQ